MQRTTEHGVPSTMKAAAIGRYGPPSVLKLHELPTPELEPDQILIALHTAGVGSWDAEMREGESPPPGRARFPRVLGLDGAGVVAAKGKRVRRFAVGDRVWAYDYDHPGFEAQYVAVDADHVGRVPKRMTLRAAGAGAVTSLTALQGVADHAKLRRGETVLIFGATGAVGTLAVQFAAARGARVIATATGRKAASLVRSLGADAAIDARSEDAVDALNAAAPNGVDVVLAFAGGDELERLLDVMPRGTRVVYPNGVDPEPKRRRGIRMRSYDAAVGPEAFTRLSRAAERARLRVPIAGKYSLSQAARAHRRIEHDHVLGRVVLSVRRGEN